MAQGNRTGPAVVPHDMGWNRITRLGRDAAADSAARIDDIADHVTVPSPNGGSGNPGTNAMASPSDHSHPADDPVAVASKLYTALVPNPLVRSGVTCFGEFSYHANPTDTYDSAGSFAGGTIYYWTQIDGVSTWLRDAVGAMYGTSTADSSGGISGGSSMTYPLQAGDRIAIVNSEFQQYIWIYEVVDPGSPTTQAVIRRAPDSNTPTTMCHGATAQIVGGGVRDGFTAYNIGYWLAIATADPIVVDTTVIATEMPTLSAPGGDEQELLTGPQLTSEGASNETLVMSWTMASGDADAAQDFFTLAGTPGLPSLPAGLWTANLPEVYVDDDSTGVTVFKWRMLKDDGGIGTDLFKIVSPPLTMSAVPMSPQYNQAVDIPFGPTSKLVAIPELSTTSPTPVTIFLRYSDPSHATWIKCPFALAMAGLTPSGSIVVPLVDTYPTLSTTPIVPPAAQTVGDFDTLAVGSIPVELNGWAKADVGFTGTLAVMIGGTKDTADGTTAATMTYTGTGAYTQILLQANITNPGGKLPVKLALSSSDAAHVFFAQGLNLVIGTGSAGASGGGGGVTLPIAESDVTGLVADLAARVTTARQVNGHSLAADVTITAADVGADAAGAAAAITLAALGGVPTSRQVAGHALTADVTISKGDVGLGNVDDTSDANKPVSTAQATAIGLKLDASDPSVTNARTPTAHAATHASAGSDAITIAESQVANLTTDLAGKESALGNPSVTGYVLSSTTGGARSWVAQSGGGGVSNWDGGQANTNYGGTTAINGGTA